MARFSAYRNTEGSGFLVDIQADLLSHLNVRVVIPLLPLDAAPKPASGLNPVFEIEGVPYALVTQYMASVPLKDLKEAAFSLSGHYDEIVAAIDILLQGF
ncbi:CcdB family protein [Paraburkholderia adhaesiva]|uniref:CcdB family protein n=1 Tax=Paraburkholderia adhaesiva TaxID=2883244 RepID=UPI001F1B0948|nr:CcdB family protein [Paraburkholderia adhaesiva]